MHIASAKPWHMLEVLEKMYLSAQCFLAKIYPIHGQDPEVIKLMLAMLNKFSLPASCLGTGMANLVLTVQPGILLPETAHDALLRHGHSAD